MGYRDEAESEVFIVGYELAVLRNNLEGRGSNSNAMLGSYSSCAPPAATLYCIDVDG
jgi:hypothetical protein